MPNALKKLCLFSLSFLLLAACHSAEKQPDRPTAKTQASSTPTDTTVIALALLPTMDCLPFYYAAERGYFARQGLRVNVLTYTSQWDCDTAIVGRTRAIGVSDLVRLAAMEKKGHRLTSLQALDRDYLLMVCGKLRLKSIEQLRLRTVAASRLSAADYWWRELMAKAGIPISDAMRPQINDLAIRTKMLDDNQVDAALLPEPYATVARLAGHKQLWQSADAPTLACLVALSSRKDLKAHYAALSRAYDMAADSLNQRGRKAAQAILQGIYGVPSAALDSLPWPKFSHARSPKAADIEKACRTAVAKAQ